MEETLVGQPKERDRGRVFIYDTLTREQSEVLLTMLPQMMRKVRPDGTKVFTEIKPNEGPVRGNLKCKLHADDPNRAYYDTLGLPVCRKSNLTAPFHVIRHMKSRHKVEWEILEQARKDEEIARRERERLEDREFQRSLMGQKTEKPPLYVSDKDKKKVDNG